MLIIIVLILISLFSLVPHFAIAETKTLEFHALQHNATNSPWLSRIKNHRPMGCRRQPWICNQDDFPRIRRLCCRNRCVDVTSDPNNCGFCGIRCPFTWQCCRGLCRNINIDPFHCGRCENRCRFPSFCIYGLCGYAQPLPPFPFPPRPRPRPWPRPRPFPPRPCPPKGGRRWGPPPVG